MECKMELADLLKPWSDNLPEGCNITGLHNDSRQIKAGDLFLAYPGVQVDGRRYCSQAIQAGAIAVAYDPEQLPDDWISMDTVIYVPIYHLAEQLAAITSRFYHYPARQLVITGVTGTNGKTTIAWQLAQAHELLGVKSAYIGTLGQGAPHALTLLNNTTPDALCLQSLFHNYLSQQTKHICMEVSSHALVQQRVAEIPFKQAIYTNLSHEHLDYHVTMKAYAEAKSLLFATPSLEYAIINYDDEYGQVMADAVSQTCKIITYGLNQGADVQAVEIKISMAGSTFSVISPWGKHVLNTQMLGEFNIYNSLAVFTSLMAEGYPIPDVISVIAQLKASPGRMELVISSPCVIVDYAHTPAALESVLITLNALKTSNSSPVIPSPARDLSSQASRDDGRAVTNKLWVVFGCGGDRDRTKRPMMGQIASQYADAVVITSDNPRTEDPVQIIQEIEKGLEPCELVKTIVDRKEAILYALNHAKSDDIVLIAGKGHENYQCIGHEKFTFSDQDVVREML